MSQELHPASKGVPMDTLRTTFLRQRQSQVPGCELRRGWTFSVFYTVRVPGAQDSGWHTVGDKSVLIVTGQTDA